MNKEPETYEELIRYKRCVDLTKYYELSKDELDKIYNYLATYPKAVIIGNERQENDGTCNRNNCTKYG